MGPVPALVSRPTHGTSRGRLGPGDDHHPALARHEARRARVACWTTTGQRQALQRFDSVSDGWVPSYSVDTVSVVFQPLVPVSASTYQWSRSGSGADIPGANGTTHTVVTGDVGGTITLTVTGSKAGYASVSRTSVAQLHRHLGVAFQALRRWSWTYYRVFACCRSVPVGRCIGTSRGLHSITCPALQPSHHEALGLALHRRTGSLCRHWQRGQHQVGSCPGAVDRAPVDHGTGRRDRSATVCRCRLGHCKP